MRPYAECLIQLCRVGVASADVFVVAVKVHYHRLESCELIVHHARYVCPRVES